MKKLTRLSTMLFLGASLFAAPVVAQEIEPGTDFTDRIVNPTFDTDYAGWTATEATPAVNFQVCEIFNSKFDFSQELTGLPAGTYQVKVDGFYRAAGNDAGAAYKAGTEVINTVVYARTSLKEKQTKLFSLYSEANPAITATLNNGYVDNMEGASQAFKAGYYVDNLVDNVIVGPDGKLVIGVKKITANIANSWCIWDNFTLTYVGEAGVGAYYETIGELYGQLEELNFNDHMPSGIYKEFNEVTQFKNEVGESSTDETLLQSLVDSLTNVAARASLAETSFLKLLEWHSTASELADKTDYTGKEDLNTALEKALDLIDVTYLIGGTQYVYAAELDEGTEDLIKAYRKYRFNEPITDAETGLDVTWSVWYNNFTSEDGTGLATNDEVTKYWVIDNVRTDTDDSHYDCRTNTVNGKYCWNNWSSACSSMNVYQEFTDLPAGIYSFSLVTTNDGAEMTDQHAYATTLSGTFDSPIATYTYAKDDNPEKVNFGESAEWEPLTTDKFIVGADGKLRIGMRSTTIANTSSGWFCFTDCELTYYGQDLDTYIATLHAQIAHAEMVLESDISKVEYNALQAAIEVAKKTDTSSIETIEAGLNTLNTAITAANEAIEALSVLKAGSYAKATAIANNEEGIYGTDIAEVVMNAMIAQETILTADTTSMAAYPAIETLLARYVSFVDAHQNCLEYAEMVGDDELSNLIINGLLPDQVAAVKANENNIEPAMDSFAASIVFSMEYLKAVEVAWDEAYDPTACNELMDLTIEQLEAVKGDYSLLPTATAAISEKLKAVTLTQGGEEKNVTQWITNPNIEQTHNSYSIAPDGWSCFTEGSNGRYTKDESGDTFFESWNSIASTINFDYNQTIMEVPAGRYRLEVMARNCQSALPNGAAVLYAVGDNEYTEPIYSHAIQTGRTEIIYDEDGTTVLYNPIDNDTLDLYVLNNIITTGGTLKIGVKNASVMNANWFAADEFKLFLLEELDGIEDTQAGQANAFSVYIENGYVKASGDKEFRLITVAGMPVDINKQLSPGMYIAIEEGTGETNKIVVQ